jgi:hypothetical protein
MTTHEEWVIKCPGCERAYDLFWISSGNNFGGKFWSDGCSVSNCSYPLTGLYSCPRCQWVFTIEDCEKIDPSDPSAEELFASRYSWLSESEAREGGRRKRYAAEVRLEKCAALLYHRRWAPQNDFEPILRIGWWWNEERDNRTFALTIDNALKAVNDTVPNPSVRTVENIQRLFEVLPSGPTNALVVGDLHRRLGNFALAIEAYSQMPSHQSELSSQLIALSQRGYRSVVRLN